MTTWAPIVISLAALSFTIASFWWMTWRVGRLEVSPPTTYAGSTQQDKLILLFPLVVYNSGPVPYVVRDLRLRFKDEPPDGLPLNFERVRSGISPSHADLVDLSAAFPVPGNTALRLFCEFQRGPVGREMGVGRHALVIEALTDKWAGWQVLVEFDLHVDETAAAGLPTSFRTFRNRPTE